MSPPPDAGLEGAPTEDGFERLAHSSAVERGEQGPLVTAAVERLTTGGLITPGTHEVVVDHAHRVVVRALDPGGGPVYVKAEVGRTRSQREVAALERAAGAGIPVPDLRHVELGDLSLLVLDEVPGRPLRARDGAATWAAAGRLLADVHRIGPLVGLQRFDHREEDWLTFMRWWGAREARLAVERNLLDPPTAGRLAQRIERVLTDLSERERVLLHGDCQPAHVLVDDRGTIRALIDWGDAPTGDPLWDLAVLTVHDPDRLAVVVEAHDAPSGATEVVAAYWAIRLLGSATWMVDHGFDPMPDIRAAAALVAA